MSNRNVEWAGPLLLILGLFLCLPFWSTGPGAEEDAWGHILTLEQWKTASEYIPSRLPGHPLYEYLTYPLHAWGGWHAVVVFSSLMTGLAAWALFVLMGKTGRAFYGSLLFLVSYPALYAGITTLDYSTSLAFMLWALVAFDRSHAWGGFLVGMATGARLTMVLAGTGFLKKVRMQSLALALLGGLAAVGLMYAWPIMSYGAQLIQTYALPYPDVPTLAYRVVFNGLTPLGALACVILMVYSIPSKSSLLLPCLAFFGLFLVYPHKGIFLLPVWALVIAMGWPRLPHRMAVVVFVLTFLGPHVGGVLLDQPSQAEGLHTTVQGRHVAFTIPGSLWQEVEKRKEATQMVATALQNLEKQPEKAVVIAGTYFAPIRYTVLRTAKELRPKVVYYCSPERMDSTFQSGANLYHLPGQDVLNNRVYGITQTNSRLLPGMAP